MTRAELLEALLVERYGPLPPPRPEPLTPAAVTAWELLEGGDEQ